MSSQASSNEYLQVVFLIDENSTNINDEIKGKDASNSVCLCVLRILSYFKELRDRNSFTLRWGFKFYNSRSLNQRYQRHNFKEFCFSEFEDFEKDVCERFEEEVRGRAQEQNSVEVSRTNDEFASNTTTTKPTASKSLTCALTDLVHDFQWEINDLHSPLRTTRRSNPLQQSSRRTHNVVFLLSNCPRDFNSLREFCGLKIQDLNSLRNAMMSTALFREFNEVYKINLNWINTDYNSESDVMDQDVIDMVEGFLQLFSGMLIPLQSLVGTQRHPPSSLDSITKTSSTQCGLAVPVMSVLCHYMGKLNCAGAVGQSCISAIQLQNSEDGTEPDSNLWVGCLCSPGVEQVVHCTLQLSSMLSSHRSTNTETRDSSSATSSVSNPSLIIRQQSSTGNTASSHKISTSESDVVPTDNKNNITQKNCPNVFWIKGAVRREKICPSWFHLTKVYTCVAMVTEKENELSSSGLSGWFQRLMLTLAKQNLSLVIELRDPESGIPVTSVLQPLTSICGVLSIVNSSKLLTLEKLLLWNQRSSSKGMVHGSEQMLVEGLHVPETTCTDGGTATARNVTSSEVHCPLIVSSSDGCSSEPFSTQDLNSWSLGLTCLEQGPDITQPPLEKCSDDGTSQESSLIKKLKELYSRKRGKKSKLEDKKTKLKHLEKRKKEKKMQDKKESQKKEPMSSVSNPVKEGILQPVVSLCNIPSNKDTQKDDTDATSEEKKKEMMILLESLQLDVEQDLRNFLKDAYHQAITNMENLTKFIDKCIAVIDFYLRRSLTDTQEMTVQGVLADCLLLSNLTIRDKYEGLKTSDCKQNKLTEYQLQVLLRLEVMCAGDENTSLIDEVVVMLRSISFIKDPGFLRDFLKEIILTRYVQHIPKFLCEIYEGLMQDLPPELQSPSKQNSEEEESPLKRNQIPSVVRPESDQPRSEISRPLTRHRSIADMGGKRREIVIPGKAKTKTKTGRRKHDNTTCLSTKEKSDHHKGKSQKTPVKKVRRNLFTEEEEETPGMTGNSMSKSKLKVPPIFGKEERSHHHRNKESRRHSVAHSKMVKETPGRKQIHNALWQKQHRARKRTSTATDLNIVKESPLKEILEAENLPRRSPRRHPGSIFQRSQSFYGGNPKSCPLERTRSSSSIRSGSPMKKLDLDENTDASNLATEAMETSTTPVKDTQDTVKESPLRFSPRRRKRFPLHTLLAKTTTRTEGDSSNNSKALTPKSKGDVPVRSSPRLLKKRSFSCIGFSSSLSSYSKSGNNSECNRISTPSKTKVPTPMRSSPRFKKSASDSTGMARNRDDLSSPRNEQNHWNPERRKKLQTPPRYGLSEFNPVESSSGNLSERTKTESTDHLMDSNELTKLSDTENDSEDSEVVLNLDKQPSLEQSESKEVYCPDGSEDQSSARMCGVRVAHEANSAGREHVLVLSSGVERIEDVDNKPLMNLVDSSINDDTSNDQNTRIPRSSQRTASFEHQCEAIASSPPSRNIVFGCDSERNGGRTEREVLSRKRLSFSPSKNMERTHGLSENPSNAIVDGCLDNEDKHDNNKTKSHSDEGTMNKESEDDRGVNTRSDNVENLVDNTLKVASPLRRSPRKHLGKNSPVCGSQRLLTPKPVVSTPPAKKRRKTRSQSEQETKRSSPLNQILKQRKRNRTGSLKSPKSKAHSEVGADTVTHKAPRDVISEGQTGCFAQLAMELLDECSKSSEDMVNDWFRNIDNQENPVEPTAMIDVSEINNIQRSTGVADFGFDEDEVFQNPPKNLRSGKAPYKPATPISAKSIKMLRESPLLVNSSSISIPPGSLSKKWSDSSPSGRERLKRRKRSEAFGGNSSELDTSPSDDVENITERNHERNSTRSRKRIKLNTN